MKSAGNVITYENIKLVSPYEIQSLGELKITKKANEHTLLQYTGIIPEDKKDSCLERAKNGDRVEVRVAGDSAARTLFNGLVSSIGIRSVRGIYYLEVEGISHTYDLDVKLRSRSFQNKSMNYADLVKKVMQAYPGADCIDTASRNAKLEEFIMQYYETDWQFLKRMASHFGALLVPCDTGDKPRFWFGTPEGAQEELPDGYPYTIGKNISFYLDTAVKFEEGADENDFTYYKVESDKCLEVGGRVNFRGKKLVVAGVCAEIKKGVLKHEYILAPEKSFRQNLILNTRITGAALEGKVIDVAKDTIRVHLETDKEQNKEEACWFPYSTFYTAEGNSGWYCMPQLGDSVKLYFPNDREENALAISSVRKGGGSSPKTADPNIKYIGTNAGKELMMGGKELVLTAKEGEIFIKLHEDQGVEIQSDKQVMIYAEKDLVMETDKKLSIEAQEEAYLQCGESSIAMNGITNVKGSLVSMEGYLKSPVPMAGGDEEMAEEEAPQEQQDDDKELLLDGAQLALDVIGMIPGVGAVANVANAAISAARGDWLGAGLSLLSCIPFAGAAIKGAKLTKTAVTAAKGAIKAAKYGKKIMKAVKTVKKVKTVVGKVVTRAWKIKSNLDRLEELKQLKDTIQSSLMDGKLDARDALAIARIGVDLYSARGGKGKGRGKSRKTPSHPKGGNSESKHLHCASDPVNVVTGSFYQEAVDLVLEDRGMEIEIKRRYNSQDTSTGPMGKGWTFEYESRIERQEDRLTLVYPDGHVKEFEKIENQWKNRTNEDESGVLSEDSQINGFVLTMKDRKTYRYDIRGKLISVSDRNGNTITVKYNAAGFIEGIISPGGKVLSFMSSQGKISQITDNIGRKVIYRYDGDNLTGVTYPNDGTVKYKYCGAWLSAITDQNGFTYVRNEYDESGRVVKQYDRDGNITDISYGDEEMETVFTYHATGVVERYRYNEQSLLTGRGYSDGTSEIYTYDRYGNKDSETDRNGRTIHRTFDSKGNLLEEKYPGGYTVKNTYDGSGNLVETHTSGGTERLFAYDKNGNLLEEREKISGQDYAVTKYAYDKVGRLLTKTDPEGCTTVFEYGENHLDKPTAVKDPEGNVFRYSYDEAGRMLSINTAYGTVKFTYNELNKKTSITDAKGNITQMWYDKMGNLIKKVLPNGYKTGEGYEYRYDVLDRLRQTIDPMQNVFAVKYDIHGNLLKEVNPNFFDSKTGDGIGVEYKYDDSNRKTVTIYPTGGAAGIKYDPAGNIIKTVEAGKAGSTGDGPGTEYAYDEMNRLVKIKDPDGNITREFVYDGEGRVIKEIDIKGNGTFYTYNDAGWLLEKRAPVGEESGKMLYNVAQYAYDKAGRKTEERISREYVDETGTPEEWNTLSYTCDKNGRITKISDTTGAQAEYAYDCLGNRTLEKIKISESKNKTVRCRYNCLGWLEKVTEGIDGEDLAQKIDGKAVAQTLYEYDGNGNITKITTPEGYETVLSYDKSDRLVRVDKRGKDGTRTTLYQYDSAGNTIKETDGSWRSVECAYDSMNRRIRITDREGGVTRLFYDEGGNIIKYVTPQNYDPQKDDGKGTTFTYDALNRLVEVRNALGVVVEKNKYNAAGELVEKSDALQAAIEYTYDIGGRIKEIITPGARQKGRASQAYTYDSLGNITGIKDGEGNYTRHILDLWGRVTEIEKADGTREKYAYDYAGNITSATDGNGNTTEYAYNSLNLLAQIKDPAGGVIAYKYDMQGRVGRKTDRNSRLTEYLYNLDDSITAKRDLATGTRKEYSYNMDGTLRAASNGYVAYTYEYTPGLNLKAKSANGKTALEYRYDRDGNVIELKDITGRQTRYKYDILGRMEEVWDGSQKAAAYTYNPDGTRASISYSNGVNVQYSYDADKNLTGILATNSEGQEILKHRYTYDNNGNQIEKEENGEITRYIYDRLNRLSKAVYSGAEEAFAYDRAGNRISRTARNITTTYSYDRRNRLREKVEGGEQTSYEYDAQGNLLMESGRRSTIQYTYDCFNRTASVQNTSGSYIKNRYDPEGLRYEVQEDGRISRFIFDGREVAAELDGNGSPKAAMIRGHELLAQKDSKGSNYFYLSNAHGDITHLLDSTGRTVNSYRYDAFGNTIHAEEKIHNRFRYAGEQYDAITNQYYLRARFYNPVVGRFTQEDEYRGDGLNLYSYVSNDPVNYIDPSGYSSTCSGKSNPWNDFQKANKGKFASSKDAAAAYKNSPSRIARSWQGKGAYPGVDSYKDITLKKGTIIYRGEPYGSEYFTTKRAVERSGRDATKLFEGLQVQKHPVKGYRPQVTGYVVTEETSAAFGITRANPKYGDGGLPQVFVPDANKLIGDGILKPVDTISLTNFI